MTKIMNRISAWGIVVALMYLVFSLAIYLETTNCHGMFCDIGIIIPIIPWSLLLPNFFWLGNILWFWVLVIINVFLLYAIFATIEKLIVKMKFK